MENDELRRLLEMAAKAEGRTLQFNSLGGVDARYPWAPHEDDGDSRRLQVALEMDVIFELGRVSTLCINPATKGLEKASELLVGDANAATRMVVLRTAAAIGESMQ